MNGVEVEGLATDMGREYYLSITLDRLASKPILMVSAEGGMEIEKVAKGKLEAIHMLHIDPALVFIPLQARRIAFKIGLPVSEFVKVALSIYKAYMEPDDNALIRHRDFEELEDLTQLDPLEVEAKKYSLNYIELDGNNGTGLAMTTMDIIKLVRKGNSK